MNINAAHPPLHHRPTKPGQAMLNRRAHRPVLAQSAEADFALLLP